MIPPCYNSRSMTPPPTNSRSALGAIFLIVVVDILGLAIVLPLLPFYAEHYNATPQVVGYLVTTYALCQLLAGPLLGRLSDSTGRRPMLRIPADCVPAVPAARSDRPDRARIA